MIPAGAQHPSTLVRGRVWMSDEHQLIASVSMSETPASIGESTLRLRLRQAVIDRFPGQSVAELVMATATEAMEYFEDDEHGPQYGVVLKKVGEPA